jgi:hypothetical protein
MVTHKGQGELFVAMKIGVANQTERDYFAIAEGRFGAARPQVLVAIESLKAFVHQHIPNDEDIFPVTLGDIIGQAVHGTPPEEVGRFPQDCTSRLFL